MHAIPARNARSGADDRTAFAIDRASHRMGGAAWQLALAERLFPRTFYGYLVLAAAICGIVAASSGHSFMIGVYTDSFMHDLELSRSTVSGIWTATLISSSLYVQAVGRLVDRLGAPRVMRLAVVPYFCTV